MFRSRAASAIHFPFGPGLAPRAPRFPFGDSLVSRVRTGCDAGCIDRIGWYVDELAGRLLASE